MGAHMQVQLLPVVCLLGGYIMKKNIPVMTIKLCDNPVLRAQIAAAKVRMILSKEKGK